MGAHGTRTTGPAQFGRRCIHGLGALTDHWRSPGPAYKHREVDQPTDRGRILIGLAHRSTRGPQYHVEHPPTLPHLPGLRSPLQLPFPRHGHRLEPLALRGDRDRRLARHAANTPSAEHAAHRRWRAPHGRDDGALRFNALLGGEPGVHGVRRGHAAGTGTERPAPLRYPGRRTSGGGATGLPAHGAGMATRWNRIAPNAPRRAFHYASAPHHPAVRHPLQRIQSLLQRGRRGRLHLVGRVRHKLSARLPAGAGAFRLPALVHAQRKAPRLGPETRGCVDPQRPIGRCGPRALSAQ